MFNKTVLEHVTKLLNAHQSKVEPSFTLHRHANGSVGITLRQVDDFAVATDDDDHHNWVHDTLKKGFKEIKDEGVITKYMAANVEQIR